jgi:Fur family transcriptional regulator, ferric uptake regulator
LTANEAVEALRSRGFRMTPQREAIVRAVFGAKSHVTAEAVHAAVRKRMRGVNMTTVYRTLQMLEDLGFVDHAHLGHEAATWTPAGRAHQHLVCGSCGALAELPDGLLPPFVNEVERATGFSIDLTHFALTGTCRACQTQR